MWDAATGDDLYRFPGLSGWINDLAISEDGNTLYTISNDGSIGNIRRWYIPNSLEQLVEWAQANRYMYDFTCEERNRYELEACTSPE